MPTQTPTTPGLSATEQNYLKSTGQQYNPTDPSTTRSVSGAPVYNPYGVRSPIYNAFALPPTQQQTSGGVPENLTPGPSYNYDPATGGIPSVPNPQATQQSAIQGNLASLGQLGQLSTGIGGINAQLGALPYQQNLPNYAGLLGKASSNTLANLSGQLPGDVITQLQQAAAERGTATGLAGSPNSNAAYLRALGLNSLALQQTGLQNFNTLMGNTPTGPQFNPSSQFIDPNMVQLAQAMANLYNAAPVPSAANNAAANAFRSGVGAGQRQFGTQGGQGQQNAPTQAQQLVGDILNRYAPTVGGTPSPTYQNYGGTPSPVYTSNTGPGYVSGLTPSEYDAYNAFFDQGTNIPTDTYNLGEGLNYGDPGIDTSSDVSNLYYEGG